MKPSQFKRSVAFRFHRVVANEGSMPAGFIGMRTVSLAISLAFCLVLPQSAFGEVDTLPAQWERGPRLPDQRTEVSMTSDGERLYVLGGFAPHPTQRASAPQAVYVYDPGDNSWSQVTDLPQGLNHAGLGYVDGRLFVVGGFREATFEATGDLHIYDIEANSWREGPSLPTARGALAVAVSRGRIHAIGGVDSNGTRTGVHEIFDPQMEQWRSASAMPTPRDHIGAVGIGNEIIVLAGRDGETFTMTKTEIYDVAADSWRGGADVPTGRSGVAAVALGGFVYLFGGESFDPNVTFDAAERYDPDSDSWATLPPMPTARHGLGAGVINGRIHVIAGGPEAGFSFSDVHEILIPGE